MEFLKYKQDNKEYYIEGYLNGDKSSRILVILKEPNTGNGGVWDAIKGSKYPHFWFGNVVNNRSAVKNGEFYYCRLNNTIEHIVDKNKKIDDCIYINLSPLWGSEKCSNFYGKVLRALNTLKKDKEKENKEQIYNSCAWVGWKKECEENKKFAKGLAKSVIKNRIALIEDLVLKKGVDTIVTMPGIYEGLKKFYVHKDEKEFAGHSGFKQCEVSIKGQDVALFRV